jgi:AbrB family looped-hinge helix DNA binding protein
MAKVTSKLQVTVPKALAERYGIRPGDEIEWLEGGDAIRVVPRALRAVAEPPPVRLALFDQATLRQRRRQAGQAKARPGRGRGWKREELYARGRAR